MISIQKKLFELKALNGLRKQFIELHGLNDDWEDFKERHVKQKMKEEQMKSGDYVEVLNYKHSRRSPIPISEESEY